MNARRTPLIVGEGSIEFYPPVDMSDKMPPPSARTITGRVVNRGARFLCRFGFGGARG